MNKFPFLSCFLAVAVIAAPVPAVFAAPTAPASPVTPAPTTPTLQLQDLPSGFRDIPPELKAQISAQLEPFKQLLAKDNLSLDNFFAFIDPQKVQIVVGYTGTLTTPAQQTAFDAALQQAQKPEFKQQMTKLQQRVQSLPVKLTGYKALPELNNFATASTGLSLKATIQNLPVQMDVVGFRRDKVGAFTAVFYTADAQPSISVKDVATKLDRRIVKPTPAAVNLPKRN